MKQFRVAEIFGPTIQGEGRRAGTPCYFIRFAGCDYRCSWCDSPHAVLPELVSQQKQMTVAEIVYAVDSLPRGPRWVVLSGGNPLLFDLTEVVENLRYKGYATMVETQGSINKDWVRSVPDVCISPKPPSAGKATSPARVRLFLNQFSHRAPKSTYYPYLKVVVFTDEDYEYAKEMHKAFEGECDFFVSVGTMSPDLPTVSNPHATPDEDPRLVRELVLHKTRELYERISIDPDMAHVRVLPQLHTLVWGTQRGR